jgi:hypothetical protein
MKRTRTGTIALLVLIGLVVGFLIEVTAVATGSPIVIPPLSLPIALVAIGIAVLVLAWPIRQATHGRPGRRVDPFLAIRVAVLAKASALSGALVLGGGLGILIYVLTRSVLPAVASVGLAIGMALGAALLLTGGLIAENFCTLPPDGDDDNERGEVRV